MSSLDRKHGSSSEVIVDSAPQDRYWDSFFGGAVGDVAKLGADELSEIDDSLDDEMLALLAYDELADFEIGNYDDSDDGLDQSHTDTSSTDTSFDND